MGANDEIKNLNRRIAALEATVKHQERQLEALRVLADLVIYLLWRPEFKFHPDLWSSRIEPKIRQVERLLRLPRSGR